VKLKLTIGYDGADFVGSQRQANVRTVQGDLERACEILADQPVAVTLAGRTDRGVHAVGQVAACMDMRPGMKVGRIQSALNRILPDDVGVSHVVRVEDGFHPRFDATWREYRYRLLVGSKQPLAGRQAWVRRQELDASMMSVAASSLCGTHDMASFTGGGEGVPWSKRSQAKRGTTRTISHCSVRRTDGWWGTVPGSGYGLEVRVVADGFLPQMVRTIVGGLVTIGQGDEEPTWFPDLLATADRRRGPVLAPAHGLILWRVGYGNDVPDPDPDDNKHVN
jgi:tRNA pseudouridine38-40 synthase